MCLAASIFISRVREHHKAISNTNNPLKLKLIKNVLLDCIQSGRKEHFGAGRIHSWYVNWTGFKPKPKCSVIIGPVS